MTKSSWLSFLLLICASCDTVFIEDSVDPRLPRYSEVGNNVAGAIYNNNEVWRVLNSRTGSGAFLDFHRSNDSVSMAMPGYIVDNGQMLPIVFSWRESQIKKYSDLTLLQDRHLSEGTGLSLLLTIQNKCDLDNKSQLIFRTVKWIEGENYFIVSGTFGFRLDADCNGMNSMTYGRFDFKIFESAVHFVE